MPGAHNAGHSAARSLALTTALNDVKPAGSVTAKANLAQANVSVSVGSRKSARLNVEQVLQGRLGRFCLAAAVPHNR
jgi:hypothetical protein